MNAMVLAAGRGTRLAQLGLGVPKALVEIGGEPLLARQLRYLHANGVRRVVVNAHHLSEAIECFAREYRSAGGPELVVLVEPELLGTAGGVRNALAQLGERAFIVLYGDVLFEEPLEPLVRAHRERGALATLAVYESDALEGKGVISVDASGRINGFVEHGDFAPGTRGLVNAGLYVVEPELVATLAPGVASDFGHDLFPAALARGELLAVHMLAAPVLDVGTPGDLERARVAL
ncbi:MAG TPA: NDP-sugar synthase [Solirubrobacteraceae bacterium]|nr:NDP-sugar synthase [Solirubrobacteraceae bacterium]